MRRTTIEAGLGWVAAYLPVVDRNKIQSGRYECDPGRYTCGSGGCLGEADLRQKVRDGKITTEAEAMKLVESFGCKLLLRSVQNARKAFEETLRSPEEIFGVIADLETRKQELLDERKLFGPKSAKYKRLTARVNTLRSTIGGYRARLPEELRGEL